MRQAEKEIKEFWTRIPLILDPGEQILKKIAKKFKRLQNNFQALFIQPYRDGTGREREKRILDPNSAHTWPGGENSEKNTRKIQKIKKQLFGIICSHMGMGQAEKERKEFQTPIPLMLDPGEESPKKNSKKIQKIKKQLSVVISSQIVMTQDQIGRERDKRILDPNSAHTQPGGANSVKKQQKNSEN